MRSGATEVTAPPPTAHTGLSDNMIEVFSDFENPRQEWRRRFSELYGTFLLVIVASRPPPIGDAP
jgi:aquaporin Z